MRRETGKRGEKAMMQTCKTESETCFAVFMLQRKDYILSSIVVRHQTQVPFKWGCYTTGSNKTENRHPGFRSIVQCSNSFISSLTLCQTLDGKLGGGENEAHGKCSAKEGIRSNQVRPHMHVQEQGRPGTNIQVTFDSRITQKHLFQPMMSSGAGWKVSLIHTA